MPCLRESVGMKKGKTSFGGIHPIPKAMLEQQVQYRCIALSMWSKRPAAAPTTAASARSSRCAAGTSTRGRSSASWTISGTRGRGARAIFMVDDNITLNVRRFEALCQAIMDNGLNDIDYMVQAMTSSIASRRDAGAADARSGVPLRLPRHREHPGRRPGVPARVRRTLRARRDARSATPPCRRSTSPSPRLYVVGGLIVGNPGDTQESIEANLEFAQTLGGLAVHPAPDALSRARR